MQVFKFTALLGTGNVQRVFFFLGGGGGVKPKTLYCGGLSLRCQVVRDFKLLCMVGMQTKQISPNNGIVNIY